MKKLLVTIIIHDIRDDFDESIVAAGLQQEFTRQGLETDVSISSINDRVEREGGDSLH